MIHTTLYARLNDNPAIANNVTGILPAQGEINQPTPFLVYTIQGEEQATFTDGQSSLVKFNIQIDGYDTDKTALETLMDQVRLSLNEWRGGNVQWCRITGSGDDKQESHHHAYQSYELSYSLANVVALVDNTASITTGQDYIEFTLNGCDPATVLRLDCEGLTLNGDEVGTPPDLSNYARTDETNTFPDEQIFGNVHVGILGDTAGYLAVYDITDTAKITADGVTGSLTATSFSGSGTSLTGVALLNGGNVFTGVQVATEGLSVIGASQFVPGSNSIVPVKISVPTGHSTHMVEIANLSSFAGTQLTVGSGGTTTWRGNAGVSSNPHVKASIAASYQDVTEGATKGTLTLNVYSNDVAQPAAVMTATVANPTVSSGATWTIAPFYSTAAVPLTITSPGLRTASVSGRSLTSNVATITTSTAHGFVVGETVIVSAVNPGTFNGVYTITAVPSTTTFTYARTASNVAFNTSTGSAGVAYVGNMTAWKDLSGATVASISYNGGLTCVGVFVNGNVTTTGAVMVGTNLEALNGQVAAQSFYGSSLTLSTPDAATVPITVQAYPGQTANLTEWQNDSSTVIASVDASGNITGGTVKAQQAGGTPGTDETRIYHDGTRGYVQSMDGNLRLIAAGGAATGQFHFADNAGNVRATVENIVGSFTTVLGYSVGGGGNACSINSNGLDMVPGEQVQWRSGASAGFDTGLKRTGAAAMKATDGASGNGSLAAIFRPVSLADSAAPINSVYYSTDAGKLVYKDSGSVVNNLY